MGGGVGRLGWPATWITEHPSTVCSTWNKTEAGPLWVALRRVS